MHQIAKIEIAGVHPVPWAAASIGNATSPTTGMRHRFTVTNKPLKAFQAIIKRAAQGAMAARPPYRGPVWLRVRLYCAHPDPRVWGTWAYVDPEREENKTRRADLTNYVKAIEDAIAGVMVANDVDVCGQVNEILWAEQDKIYAEVIGLGASDKPS